jgi:hypothetical protein
VRRRIRVGVLVNVRATEFLSKRLPEANLVRRLGGHYSTTRALLAAWLQRNEFRADRGI